MCGITGIIGFERSYKPNKELLKKMTSILHHRGPDDEGIYINENVGLGHRRLSILDLTSAGHQPMCNEDQSIWITFNGEIYNYTDYIPELLKKGHVFKSRCDTEMIIHAYEEWGIDGCIERLNGMFAFGLWDNKKMEFYLVRDRMGIKPVFYSIQKDRLLFASEIKAILVDKSIPKEIDLDVLSSYLSMFYTSGNDSILKHIKQLEAGHYLSIKKNTHIVKEYWDIELHQDPIYTNEKTIYNKFDELFYESVKLNLVSDVPVGLMLSRGIDSNAVLYYMNKCGYRNINSFTVDTMEQSFSEGTVAKQMANLFKSNHTNFLVSPELTLNDFDWFVWHQDHLNGNSAVIGWHFLFKLIKESQMSVALNGCGPDEMFGGYETYRANRIADTLKTNLFKPAKWLLSATTRFMPHSFEFISTDYKLRKLLEGTDFHAEKSHYWWRTILVDQDKKQLFKAGLHELINFDSFYFYEKYFTRTADKQYSFLDRCLYSDIKMFLGHNVLMMVDSASMAHSVEARPPLLNHKFVEFAFQIPQNYKMNRKNLKVIIRKGMVGKLPDDFLQLPKKGMNLPLSFWIENQMKSFVLDTLSRQQNDKIGLFNYCFIEKLLKDHFEHKSNNMYKIWNLVIFFRWYNVFILSEGFDNH